MQRLQKPGRAGHFSERDGYARLMVPPRAICDGSLVTAGVTCDRHDTRPHRVYYNETIGHAKDGRPITVRKSTRMHLCPIHRREDWENRVDHGLDQRTTAQDKRKREASPVHLWPNRRLRRAVVALESAKPEKKRRRYSRRALSIPAVTCAVAKRERKAAIRLDRRAFGA